MNRRKLLIGVGALLSLIVCIGCLSPTLPLPPPSAPLVTAPNDEGFVRISGRVQPQSAIYIRNLRTNKGVNEKTQETGKYDLLLRAEIGDVLSIWERRGADESHPLEVTVPKTTNEGGIPPIPQGEGGQAP